MAKLSVRAENIPIPPSPERPPLAPYDPPDPAPQAAAWRRAINVVTRQVAQQNAGSSEGRAARSRSRGIVYG